jgi:hypothetical protein
MVHLPCENGKRYLRALQADCGEEVGCAQIVQINASALDSTGAFVRPACLDIEVLHQRDTGEEVLAGCQAECLGNQAERLEYPILAFQGIRCLSVTVAQSEGRCFMRAQI